MKLLELCTFYRQPANKAVRDKLRNHYENNSPKYWEFKTRLDTHNPEYAYLLEKHIEFKRSVVSLSIESYCSERTIQHKLNLIFELYAFSNSER